MKKIVSVLVAIGALAGVSAAQTITSSLVGSVTDSSAAVVAGAVVSLTQVSTGAERQAASDERGNFVFSSIQLGEYTLSVTAPGFKRYEKRGLRLSAQETLSAGTIAMEVGAVTESVTVTSQGVAVQTASAERAGTILGTQVENLMIKGRNAMSLLQLLPGVVDLQNREEKIDRNFDIFVQGNRAANNSVTIDGMVANPYGNNFNTVVVLGQDAIAEVRVLLTNFQAEYGHASGATVNIVSKSGGKDFHGLGSHFWRHEQFNANNFFNNRLGRPNPRYRYNTWNYNVGGPISIGGFNRDKDKVFFFWSQEFWPLKIPTAIRQITMPTDLERAGDFSQTLDVNNRLITITDPTTRQPFPSNRIPTNRIDPSGQALLKVFPAPNFLNRAVSGGNYNYIFQDENSIPTRLENLRLDYKVTPSHTLSGTVASFIDHQEGATSVLTADTTNWAQMRRTYRLHGQAYILRYTGIFSPTLIHEASLGFTRRPEGNTVAQEEITRNQRKTAGYVAGQLNPANNPLDFIPLASFGGVPNAANLQGTERYAFKQALNNFALTDNLTKTAGAHTLKFGLTMERHFNGSVTTNVAGTVSFARDVNNPLDSNYAYSNAATGVYATYSETLNVVPAHTRQFTDEWFAQDNWKVNRRLTLDIGVRFHHFTPIFRSNDVASGFEPGRYDRSRAVRLIAPALVNGQRAGIDPVTGRTFLAAQIGAVAPNSGDSLNGIVLAGKNGTPRGFFDGFGVLPAPRFGFAYDVFGDGKTAVRGGWAMFFTRPNFVNNPGAQIPFVETPNLFYGTLLAIPTSSGVVFPGNITGIQKDIRSPRTMNFSLSVQRNVGFGTVVDVAYVGSLGRNLMWAKNFNDIPLGANFNPANIDSTNRAVLPQAFLRPTPGFNNITIGQAAASSSYHSMQTTARRRFTSGLQFGLSWTWSKTMDYADTDTTAISSLVDIKNWNYGLAGFDRTHVFRVDWLYNVPKAPVKNAILRKVLHDWQLSGITSFQSGAPTSVTFTTVVATDITGTASLSPRIFVKSNPVLPKSERTFSRNFRTDVFGVPAVGTVGNAAKTLIRGPGRNNWDIAVFKDFPVREKMRLQYRLEMYNTFNHAQFSGMDTTARFDAQGNQVNTRLGEFTSALAARVMQMALRFQF